MSDLDDVVLPMDGEEVPEVEKALEVDGDDLLEVDEDDAADEEMSDDDDSLAE